MQDTSPSKQREFKPAVRWKQAELLVAYLEGKTLEYYTLDSPYSQWEEVLPYQSPIDVYRVSGKAFKFRIKE